MDGGEMEGLREERPAVVLWFKIYSLLMAFLYLLVALAGPLFIFSDPESLGVEPVFAKILGAVCIVIGLPFMVIHLLPIFLKPTPRTWMLDMVLICLGLTGCTFPASIALLVFWIQPETKRHFGKKD